MRLGSVLACVAFAPLLVAASQPVRLQPASGWIVDYAENSCRLIRTFGEGKYTVVLMFESEAPGRLDMMVVGKPLVSDSEAVSARFLPVQSKPIQGLAAKSSSTGDPAILWSSVVLLPDDVRERAEKEWKEYKPNPGVRPPPRNLVEEATLKPQRQEFASKATELQIEAWHNRPVILETGSLGDAIKVFDKCTRDSLRDWGVDPDLEDKIARPVWAANVSQWFSGMDYPAAMLDQGQESDVKVRLLVDASGRITKCTSLSHFKAPEFNQVVCADLMKRGRFEPAELADGTKVPSYYATQIRWRIAH